VVAGGCRVEAGGCSLEAEGCSLEAGGGCQGQQSIHPLKIPSEQQVQLNERSSRNEWQQ